MVPKIKKWPNDWEIHITKFCELYFCDKEIDYRNKIYWVTVSTDDPDNVVCNSINLYFIIEEHYYVVCLNNNKNHFSCDIFFLFKEKEADDEPIICCSSDIAMMSGISGMGGHNLTVVSLIEFIEDSIMSDHIRRKNDNDWDNGDEDNNPISPFSPTEIVTPDLLLV